MMNEEVKQAVQELRNALSECVHRCNHCFTSCLMEDDVKMMADCIRRDKDCIEACTFAMKFLYKKSRFKREVLMLCKNVCIVCAQECEKHNNDHCRMCAQACKQTAEKIDGFLEAHKRAHEQRSSTNSSSGVSC